MGLKCPYKWILFRDQNFYSAKRLCCGFEERLMNKVWLGYVYEKDETLLVMDGSWCVINSPHVLLVEIMSIRA